MFDALAENLAYSIIKVDSDETLPTIANTVVFGDGKCNEILYCLSPGLSPQLIRIYAA